MNPRYKTGIILFGAVAPCLILLIIFGVLASQKARISEEYTKRKGVYTNNERSERTAKGIKAQLSVYKEREGHWDSLLKNSDVGSVTGLLKEISSSYSAGEKFRQNDFKFVNRETGIGAASQQPSVTYNISLSGTYQALQESILSLESQMPNLSLNSLDLKPQKEGQLLEAELSYSAWIN
ncbi:hypothetical protein [Roseibacillus persicicus]|uniref:Uncharacterized protein n=1 Tax=Roseibacillus persicicus TaxID=454148 RepID=A0A918WFY7_9BACT|nr:hypothetical protein [Roseibacillus persicicus]MDQ8190718.1 hypothetical protein [Roseibacillus persicicus]GHC40733.1 hypothetical protein GCM10007100_01580 [Roseibacillus persicicus]